MPARPANPRKRGRAPRFPCRSLSLLRRAYRCLKHPATFAALGCFARIIMPRIALIHAVSVAMAPVHDAFRQLWPEAECIDILDTSLSRDRERDSELTKAMVGRFLLLAKYAEDNGAAGILFTCSAFGEAIEAAATKAHVPVLKPNEAMFEGRSHPASGSACWRRSSRASPGWKRNSAISPPLPGQRR